MAKEDHEDLKSTAHLPYVDGRLYPGRTSDLSWEMGDGRCSSLNHLLGREVANKICFDEVNGYSAKGVYIPGNVLMPPWCKESNVQHYDLNGEPFEVNDDGSPRRAGGKDTNPKDAVGIKKWRQLTVVPFTVIWEIAVGLLEGARKYGRHNYRVSKVRASVYVDAAMAGHLMPWWEGEDIDEESGLNHITKAICSLVVLRDAMIQGMWVDDRPPKTDMAAVRDNLQQAVNEIFERHPVAVEAYLEGDQHD